MSELFRFLDVRCDGSECAYSFTLRSGEIRLLQLASKAEKDALIDCAVGETHCAQGRIEITLGERRGNSSAPVPAQGERRRRNGAVPVIWQPIGQSRAGRVGWVGNGGLVSNLKVWENVTLPLWYHTHRDAAETERSVAHWLEMLGLAKDDWADFMAAPPSRLEHWQRKLAGLLRGLVQMPRVLVVDAMVFEDVQARLVSRWITALETFAAQGRAVLVLTDKATMLPLQKIE